MLRTNKLKLKSLIAVKKIKAGHLCIIIQNLDDNMSCYLRHIEDVLKEAEIKLTKENRKAIDEKIHKIVHVKYKNCPKAWETVKERILKDRKEFVEALKGSVV